MRINSLLGLAAVAGAAYFLKSEKGKSFINQNKGQFTDWYNKGEQALRNVTERFKNQDITARPYQG